MAIEKPKNCTTRSGCKTPPTASFEWANRTLYACGPHLEGAEQTAKALGKTIDPQPYPPPKPATPAAPQNKSTAAKPAKESTTTTKPPTG